MPTASAGSARRSLALLLSLAGACISSGQAARQLGEGPTVRLVPPGPQGRLEVLHGGAWRAVCDEGFDDRDANVACRQLGYTGGRAHWGGLFESAGAGTPRLIRLGCSGLEGSLTECSSSGWSSDCPSDDATVVCYDERPIRLVDGSGPAQGRLEVLGFDGRWAGACEKGWREANTALVCKQLGYASLEAVAIGGSMFGSSEAPLLMSGVFCTGLERHLAACPFAGWGAAEGCDAEAHTVGIDCLGTTAAPPPPDEAGPPDAALVFPPPSPPPPPLPAPATQRPPPPKPRSVHWEAPPPDDDLPTATPGYGSPSPPPPPPPPRHGHNEDAPPPSDDGLPTVAPYRNPPPPPPPHQFDDAPPPDDGGVPTVAPYRSPPPPPPPHYGHNEDAPPPDDGGFPTVAPYRSPPPPPPPRSLDDAPPPDDGPHPTPAPSANPPPPPPDDAPPGSGDPVPSPSTVPQTPPALTPSPTGGPGEEPPHEPSPQPTPGPAASPPPPSPSPSPAPPYGHYPPPYYSHLSPPSPPPYGAPADSPPPYGLPPPPTPPRPANYPPPPPPVQSTTQPPRPPPAPSAARPPPEAVVQGDWYHAGTIGEAAPPPEPPGGRYLRLLCPDRMFATALLAAHPEDAAGLALECSSHPPCRDALPPPPLPAPPPPAPPPPTPPSSNSSGGSEGGGGGLRVHYRSSVACNHATAPSPTATDEATDGGGGVGQSSSGAAFLVAINAFASAEPLLMDSAGDPLRPPQQPVCIGCAQAEWTSTGPFVPRMRRGCDGGFTAARMHPGGAGGAQPPSGLSLRCGGGGGGGGRGAWTDPALGVKGTGGGSGEGAHVLECAAGSRVVGVVAEVRGLSVGGPLVAQTVALYCGSCE